MATAAVEISIDGIDITVSGIKLVRQRDHNVTVEMPTISDDMGRPAPCIGLPDEITRAIDLVIRREVLETVAERMLAATAKTPSRTT